MNKDKFVAILIDQRKKTDEDDCVRTIDSREPVKISTTPPDMYERITLYAKINNKWKKKSIDNCHVLTAGTSMFIRELNIDIYIPDLHKIITNILRKLNVKKILHDIDFYNRTPSYHMTFRPNSKYVHLNVLIPVCRMGNSKTVSHSVDLTLEKIAEEDLWITKK